MDINTITLEKFVTLNEEEKLQCIKDIKHTYQFEKIKEILSELGLENVSGQVSISYTSPNLFTSISFQLTVFAFL